jgi:hypothetical protein
MTTPFERQGAARIKKIAEQKLRNVGTSGRLGLELLPIVKENATTITYEQLQPFRGLMAARGMGGPAGRAQLPGATSWSVSPGYYATTTDFRERDLLERRQVGDWTQFDRNGNMTSEASDLILQQMYDRMEENAFRLLATGGFEVRTQGGTVSFQDVYNVPVYVPGVPYSTLATAAPLAHIRLVIADIENGVSVDFRNGTLVMNRVTVNAILNNANAADLGGKRIEGGNTTNGLDQLNEILAADDLPAIQVYNKGYFPEGVGAHVKFLRDGEIVLVGRREDGEPIGESVITNAVQAAGASGEPAPDWFVQIDDQRAKTPPFLSVTGGFNGGARLYHSYATARITAF